MRTGPGLHYWNLLTPSSVLRDTGTLTAQLTQLALRECGSYLPSYQIMPGDSHTSFTSILFSLLVIAGIGSGAPKVKVHL